MRHNWCCEPRWAIENSKSVWRTRTQAVEKIARSCRQPAVIVSIWPRDAALDNGALCMRQNRPSINLTAVDAAIMGILMLL